MKATYCFILNFKYEKWYRFFIIWISLL